MLSRRAALSAGRLSFAQRQFPTSAVVSQMRFASQAAVEDPDMVRRSSPLARRFSVVPNIHIVSFYLERWLPEPPAKQTPVSRSLWRMVGQAGP